MTRVVDTSVLIAALNEDDVHHERAMEALADNDPLQLPAEILVETVDLVAYRHGKGAAVKAAALIRALPHVRMAEKPDIDAVLAVHREHKALSLADAVVVQTCRALGCRPLTFDKALAKAASR